MVFNMKSAEQMAEEGAGVPVPEEEYLAEIKGIEFLKDHPAYGGGVEDCLKVKLTLLSFADATELIDIDGNPIPARDISTFIRHNRVGMVPQVSKARKFFTSALGIPVADGINIQSWDDLLGKRVIVATVNKPDKNNPKVLYSRVADFKQIRRRPDRKPQTPALTDADVANAAAAVGATATDADGEELQF